MSVATQTENEQLAINGGAPSVTEFEGIGQPKFDMQEFMAIVKRFGLTPEAVERISQTVGNDDFMDDGPNFATYISAFPAPSSNIQFEQKAREMFGSPFALGTSSGTGALHAAMVAAGAAPGKQVIIPALGFMATSAAAAITGATPVFCDVDESLQIDPTKIEECITSDTVAIAPTHHWGIVADMEPIMEVARKHNLKVIEDCAQSPGAKYRGRYVGTIGDLGCFSISAYKIIGGGEGGMILARDERIFERACQLAECGGLWRENRFAPPRYEGELFAGTNYRMSEFEATVDLVQLGKLDGIVERTRSAYTRVAEQLETFAEITPQKVNDRDGLIGYQLVFFPETRELCEKLAAALQAEGVPAGTPGFNGSPDWHVCSEMQPMISTLGKESRFEQCPVGTDLYRRKIALGINQWWTQNDCDAIAAGLNKVFRALCTQDASAKKWLA